MQLTIQTTTAWILFCSVALTVIQAQPTTECSSLYKKVLKLLKEQKQQENCFTGCSAPPMTGDDCADIKKRYPTSTNGVYSITRNDTDEEFQVYCDMTTSGGGWTVFQRRIDGSVKFYRPWNDYVQGFGKVEGEYWLGNDRLSYLTSVQQYRLRVDLGNWDGNYRYAEYNLFIVSNAADKYRLTLGSYTGDAGDSLTYNNGQQFSTHDQDNGAYTGYDCAAKSRGAWWYNFCSASNLNGEYNNTEKGRGVNWDDWLGPEYSLRFTEMKIRPVTF